MSRAGMADFFFFFFGTVLGLNDTVAARKLVRLLLADPLDPKEDWEDVLNSSDADISRGLLIRYCFPLI